MNVTYGEHLNSVIEKGIQEAPVKWGKPEHVETLAGALEGLENCRGKWYGELRKVLGNARALYEARSKQWPSPDWRAFEKDRGELWAAEFVLQNVEAALVNLPRPWRP